MPESITIEKNLKVPESCNYALLRQKGLQYIRQLGSRLWTDYNIHDPGITILEALCYAITDLGYRSSFDIRDLLALNASEIADESGQFSSDKRQAFFTARHILTVNPLTINDFRKLLISIEGIKNGWLVTRACSCGDFPIFADCKKNTLQYAQTGHKIAIKGLYDVLVEFDDEEKCGNLNSGKIKYNFSFAAGSRLGKAEVEMRLPSWPVLEKNKEKFKPLLFPESQVIKVVVNSISGNKNDSTDIPSSPETVLDHALRKPVYANITVTCRPSKNNPATILLNMEDVPVKVWFRNTGERQALVLNELKMAIEDCSASGILPRYLEKIKKAETIIAETRKVLHSHRNLAEDFCSIRAIEVEDLGVCLDMEVEPKADIEAILGEAYFLIDQYFSPDLRFYSLQQLLDEKIPTDEIFDGPALSNGFIKNKELAEAVLPTMLYASDIINLLMDIQGVISVKNFLFSRFDTDGNVAETQPWSIPVTPNHQPRLYIEASRVLVFKNGLPFLADSNEMQDTLQTTKGRHLQPKFPVFEHDLPVPRGTAYDLNAYFPVQESLPDTYGVGYAGLPETASEKRKAQAKQLKAYLLFYEQLLVNYLAQLANIRELFAVDETVKQTYFSRFIETTEIPGLGDLYKGFSRDVLTNLTETADIFLDRRNRFLDHLLARFAESFNDYALMLYSYSDDADLTGQQLIGNKIEFIRKFPEISRNRARSFNYKDPAALCSSKNLPGLVQRIGLLLGYGRPWSGYMDFTGAMDSSGKLYERRWRLTGPDGKALLTGITPHTGASPEIAASKALNELSRLFDSFTVKSRYRVRKVTKYLLGFVDENSREIAVSKKYFDSAEEAETARDEIIAFINQLLIPEQIFIVEHLLLRPRNKPSADYPEGDPLLPVCLPKDCPKCCGSADPYSFRITIVLNGETGLAEKGLEFRKFAEQTIRMEAPAHLGIKICWVSKKQLFEFQDVYCDWLSELAKPESGRHLLHTKLIALIKVFSQLKNVYPPAALFDCRDGNDENRVILGNTAVTSNFEPD